MSQAAHGITRTPQRRTNDLHPLYPRHQRIQHSGDFLPRQMLPNTHVYTAAKGDVGS